MRMVFLAVYAVVVALAFLSPRSLALAKESGWHGARAARAVLIDESGQTVGQATLEPTPHGVHLDLALDGVPPGAHALHIHEKGACEPPFLSAGGHYNPERKAHGVLDPEGMHAGDLPNIHVGDDRRLHLELFVPNVSLDGSNALLGGDGTSLVIHEGEDDYRTDPAGTAGGRIACGVIAP